MKKRSYIAGGLLTQGSLVAGFTVTEKELLASVKAMKANKSPGTDGLTAESYKFVWIDIKSRPSDIIMHSPGQPA